MQLPTIAQMLKDKQRFEIEVVDLFRGNDVLAHLIRRLKARPAEPWQIAIVSEWAKNKTGGLVILRQVGDKYVGIYYAYGDCGKQTGQVRDTAEMLHRLGASNLAEWLYSAFLCRYSGVLARGLDTSTPVLEPLY